MTVAMTRELKVIERRMLRKIVGVQKRRVTAEPTEATGSEDSDTENEQDSGGDVSEHSDDNNEDEESWNDWIRRATGIAEDKARRAKVRDWVEAQRKAKWSLAGHIARRTDGRWSSICLQWDPEHQKRRVGRPCKRWADIIKEFLEKNCNVSQNLTQLAENRNFWHYWLQTFGTSRQ